MEYIFRTTTYDVEALVPEMAKALEKRAEMNAAAAVMSGAQKKRKKQSAAKKRGMQGIYGIALLVLALYLLLPSLGDIRGNLLKVFAAIWSGSAAAYTFMLMIRGDDAAKPSTKNYEKPARNFLAHIAKGEPSEIRFNEDGMTFVGAPTVLYRDLERFIETPAGYFLTWTNKAATFLQKKDLAEGDAETFAAFVTAHL